MDHSREDCLCEEYCWLYFEKMCYFADSLFFMEPVVRDPGANTSRDRIFFRRGFIFSDTFSFAVFRQASVLD